MINLSEKQRWIAGEVTVHELEVYGRKQHQRRRDAIDVGQLSSEIGVSPRTFDRWEAMGDAPPSLKKGRHSTEDAPHIFKNSRERVYPLGEARAWLFDKAKSQTDPAIFAMLIPHITEDMPLELLKQKRAAEIIGVTTRTLHRRFHKGTGPVCVRIGQGVYYPRAFLEIWRDQNPRQNGGVK